MEAEDPDVTVVDVKALVIGCCANRNNPDPYHAATRRVLSIITAGLRFWHPHRASDPGPQRRGERRDDCPFWGAQ